MRYDVAPHRLLIWLAAAVVGWAVVIGVCLYLPQAFAGFAAAGVMLWRKGQRPVAAAVSTSPVTAAAGTAAVREDVHQLVASSV